MNEPLDSIDFDHLLEVAHLALDERMLVEAQEMFALLTVFRPTNPHPRIGQALIFYAQHQSGDAIVLLEAILRDFPNAVFTRSLLAKMLSEADQPDWQHYAHEVIERASSGVAFEMAAQLLGAPNEDRFTTRPLFTVS